jgi:hypothetical protein
VVELHGAEHLVEVAHVAELLGEMVAADLPDRRPRLRQGRAGVPGRRDADPLVARQLLDAGEEQGLPVDRGRVVPEDHVVPVELLGIGERAPRRGSGLKARAVRASPRVSRPRRARRLGAGEGEIVFGFSCRSRGVASVKMER